jgi:hypothetical protein
MIEQRNFIPSTRTDAQFCSNVTERPESFPLRVNKARAKAMLSIPKYQHQPTQFLALLAEAHLARLKCQRMFNLATNPDRVLAIAVLEGVR